MPLYLSAAPVHQYSFSLTQTSVSQYSAKRSIEIEPNVYICLRKEVIPVGNPGKKKKPKSHPKIRETQYLKNEKLRECVLRLKLFCCAPNQQFPFWNKPRFFDFSRVFGAFLSLDAVLGFSLCLDNSELWLIQTIKAGKEK